MDSLLQSQGGIAGTVIGGTFAIWIVIMFVIAVTIIGYIMYKKYYSPSATLPTINF